MPELSELQVKLGIRLKDDRLLEQALRHSSFANENPGRGLDHNERLEYLGDAILDFIIAEKLYRDFPAFSEGEMTKLRAALVRRETLARIAREIDLGDYLSIGKGEESSGGRNKTVNLAGAMEAVIAAVYLEGGMLSVSRMVTVLWEHEFEKAAGQGKIADTKSKLQEETQLHFKQTPFYRLVKESGPDHDKTFIVNVEINGNVMGTGSGKSKKQAETEAAAIALKKIQNDFTK